MLKHNFQNLLFMVTERKLWHFSPMPSPDNWSPATSEGAQSTSRRSLASTKFT